MSIDCRELRIGNVVSVNGKFNVIVIEIDCNGITYDRIDYSEVAAHVEYKYLQPIELRTEILEKCRFEKYDDTNRSSRINLTYRKGKLGLEWRENKNVFTVMWYDANDDYGSPIVICVDCLHQLQNLHFSLTGTELEPKL